MTHLAGLRPRQSASDDVYDGFAAPTNQPSGWGSSQVVGGAGGGGGGGAFATSLGGAGGGNPLAQRPAGSSWGGGPPPGSSLPPGTAMRAGGGADARPMTSNRASGYNAASGGVFDPAAQARSTAMGPAPPLHKREENSPEEECNEMEKKVNALIEESAVLAMQGDFSQALEKAKDAGKKERALCKQREQLQLSEQINVDLTHAVHFNLAVQYHNNKMHTEALNTYSLIIRNTQFQQSGRLRVNMGNIYAEQKNYATAIKMYRKALEDVPPAAKELRFKIMRNVGNAFVKMGQYRDAISSFETIMESSPDLMTGFNLLLCYYGIGDTDKLKRTFSRLLSITVPGVPTEEDEEKEEAANAHMEDAPDDDALRREVKERRRNYLTTVTIAARLVAPVLDRDWRVGYDYIIEQLRHYEMKDASSRLASELEMCKALNYLKFKKYKEAIDGLKAFEKKDKVLRSKAATNLTYLYFLEGDFDSGEKYADMSVESNSYNPKALVNKGDFLFMRQEYERAKQYYSDAIAVEADNIEAIYNYGLACKQLTFHDEALRVFKRLQSLVDSVEVLYQIADLYDILGDARASEWFNRLITRVPTDPNVLARLGLLCAKDGDESQAFHFYLEAYRYYQVNMDVISWLGAYFVKNEVYDKAIQFFERAAQIQPREVKWQLMVASCYRRRGEYATSKRLYEDIHRRHPENTECLRYLVHLCKDSGLIDEANDWYNKVKKLERQEQERAGTTTNGSTFGAGGGAAGQGSASPQRQGSADEDMDGNMDGGSGRGSAGAAGAEKSQAGSGGRGRAAAKPDDDDDDVMLPGT